MMSLCRKKDASRRVSHSLLAFGGVIFVQYIGHLSLHRWAGSNVYNFTCCILLDSRHPDVVVSWCLSLSCGTYSPTDLVVLAMFYAFVLNFRLQQVRVVVLVLEQRGLVSLTTQCIEA